MRFIEIAGRVSSHVSRTSTYFEGAVDFPLAQRRHVARHTQRLQASVHRTCRVTLHVPNSIGILSSLFRPECPDAAAGMEKALALGPTPYILRASAYCSVKAQFSGTTDFQSVDKGYRRRTGSPSYKYNSTPTLKVDRALLSGYLPRCQDDPQKSRGRVSSETDVIDNHDS